MSDIALNFDFDRYPTLLNMVQSTAMVRIAIGPAGSGKTTGCIAEIVRMAIAQEPASDGTRYSYLLVIRNTYDQLKRNTVKSFNTTLGPLYNGKDSTPPSAKVYFPLADGTKVNLDIDFLSMDKEEDQQKLLGAEPTFVFIDEISEVEESLLYAVVRRLGRYPSGAKGRVTRTCVIAATNGPIRGSWLHKLAMGERAEEIAKIEKNMRGKKFVEIFQQPPALIRPTDPNGDWTPNPLAENIDNLELGYDYYYLMLADSDDSKIQSYVEGDYADLVSGTPVFPEFGRASHVIPRADAMPKGNFEYFLSFDFGRTPVCLLGYITGTGIVIILDEFMGKDMSVEQLYKQVVFPAIKRKYPNGRCVRAWGDPAGMVGGQNIALSPFDILRREKVPITAPTRSNKVEPRLAAVRGLLNTIAYKGTPRLVISDNCTFLIESLMRTYIYEHVRGSRSITKDAPTKSHVNWASDLADALQYLCLGELRISAEEEVEEYEQVETNWYA